MLTAARERCGLTGTDTTSSIPTLSSVSRGSALGHVSGGVSDELMARLLVMAERSADDSIDRPPVSTCRIEAGPHGDVYRATNEWLEWMRRSVPGYGDAHRSHQPPSRRAPDPEGAEPKRERLQMSAFKEST